MRLIEVLTPPFKLNGREVTVGVRVGIAVAPTDATEAEALRRNADIALTGAKADGTGCFRFFEPEMNRLVQARRTLEADLRRALEDGEFELFYQPLLRIATREVVGFEALLRWRHPTRGLVLPGEFVPLAEETGLIVPIGEWVLATACAEAVGWLEQLNVAVNLSPVQVRHRGLAAALGMALARSGLAPSRLELEITETVLLQDTVETLAILRQIKALGVTIAMDDFGTGFSSLSYLRRFPFSKVKIDRSFVQDLGRCDEATAIVRAIIGLCADLGMSTLAEGVEREDQLAILGGEHCADAQGYLFGQPRPSSMVQEMLRQSPDGRLPARAAPDGRQLVQASGV
jgi:predicted signal transduction protein with EAL and GGDEF domain